MKIIEPKVELWQQGNDSIVLLIIYLNVENNGKYL